MDLNYLILAVVIQTFNSIAEITIPIWISTNEVTETETQSVTPETKINKMSV